MRAWTSLLLLLLPLNLAAAAQDVAAAAGEAKSVREKIAQKILMIDVILNSPDLHRRAARGDDPVASELLSRAARNFVEGEAYFDQGRYLEAEAMLDYVLRDLGAGSRLLGTPQRRRNEYRRFVRQLDAFVLPEWRDLGEDNVELLQGEMVRVSGLRDRAARLAADAQWDEAIALLEQAYQVKVSLLERFGHQATIVYDLDFDTVQDEYRYLVDRTYHYLELVQTVLARGEVDDRTRGSTDRNLYDAMLNLETAEDYEAQGLFAEAIPVLGQAIDRLLAVLEALGVSTWTAKP